MHTIYLASKSPRRQTLLKQLGVKFELLVPKISEKIAEKDPKRLAMKLAQHKVKSVESKINNGIIIGVDTIVVIHNRILGKPKNKNDARKMIQLLNGKEHKVISGLYILSKPANTSLTTYELTKVKFRRLSQNEIEEYIASREPYDKAGGYAIQGKAIAFVESINGCLSNVVGLPIRKLLLCLKKLGYSLVNPAPIFKKNND